MAPNAYLDCAVRVVHAPRAGAGRQEDDSRFVHAQSMRHWTSARTGLHSAGWLAAALILERDADLGAKRFNFAILQLHVQLCDFGNP